MTLLPPLMRTSYMEAPLTKVWTSMIISCLYCFKIFHQVDGRHEGLLVQLVDREEFAADADGDLEPGAVEVATVLLGIPRGEEAAAAVLV